MVSNEEGAIFIAAENWVRKKDFKPNHCTVPELENVIILLQDTTKMILQSTCKSVFNVLYRCHSTGENITNCITEKVLCTSGWSTNGGQ